MTPGDPSTSRPPSRARVLRAFFRMPGSRSFGTLLVLFLALTALSVVVLRTSYVDPQGGSRFSLLQSIYAVFTLLTFETAYPLPLEWGTALIFFAVPLMGLFVLGHGLVRVGQALLDRKAWEAAMASTYENHIVVCGLGKVGYRVTRWLVRLGEPVVGIERDEHGRFIDEIRSWKVPVIIADARRPEVLEQAGIARASSVVPCADDDLTNLDVALEARRLCAGIKVVLRMFDERLAENVEQGFGIQTAFSTSALAAPAFAAAATRAPVDYAFAFGDVGGIRETLLTVSKFTVVAGSKLVGQTLEDLEREFEVAVLLHRHGDSVQIHPAAHAVLAEGDGFVVSAEIDALRRLAAVTPPTRELRRKASMERAPKQRA